MDFDPALCGHCPIPLGSALASAGQILLLLWAGLSLRNSSSWLARAAGGLLLLLSILTTLFTSLLVLYYGTTWAGLRQIFLPRLPRLDLAFVAFLLLAQLRLWLWTRRALPREPPD